LSTVASDPEALLALAVAAASEAGALLRERFEAGPEREVNTKSTPTDLVSEADLAAQRAIHSLISAERPDDGFLAEEEGADAPGSSGLQWIVDPLDGTINFLFGIAEWCVSIAVRDNEGTLAGVIHNPIASLTFTAVRGGQPEQNGAPISQAVHRVVPLGEALIATGFGYDAKLRAAQGEVISHLLPQVRDIRRFGSAALDLAWTAAGRYQAYFERGINQWDVAAGVLLCESAGLEVHELPARGDLRSGVLVAPAALAEQMLALVG
jgi:myo-inositol-1(or 4)-monophosphatase